MVETKQKLRVAVLMGGLSSERDISLSTGKQVLEALDPGKYEVIGVDAASLFGVEPAVSKGAGIRIDAVAAAQEALMSGSGLASLADIAGPTATFRPDVVFIALHGRYGEDGTIQGLLELLGMKYTGSGVLASALAMDKSMAKKVMACQGIPVPRSVEFIHGGLAQDTGYLRKSIDDLGYPVMVKPSRQGSTIGMTKVNQPDELKHAIETAAGYDHMIVVEEFVEGTELTVGVLGNEQTFALPAIEIVPAKGVYDYEAKYTPGATDEIVPARVSPEDRSQAQRLAMAAHAALGCSGMSRTDMILGPGGLNVIEVNTIPGMTPTSLLPKAAEASGIPFVELLDIIIDLALEGEGKR